MVHALRTICLLIAATIVMTGCQSPTEPNSAVRYEEVVDVVTTPNPLLADPETGGRTYRVVRGNNQPDEILSYDWHAIFSATVTFSSRAASNDVDLEFPVRITSTTLTVKQASGGIVTPPTGTETEKFEFVTLNATGNQVTGTDSPVNLTFEVWYDLPSLRREAVVTLLFSFVDADGVSFQKSLDLTVAP